MIFLQQNHPTALPHVRIETTAPAAAKTRPEAKRPPLVSAADDRPRHPADPHDSQMFTGSIEAVARSRAFSGPGEEVFEDREKTITAQDKPDADEGQGREHVGQVFPAYRKWLIIRRW